MMELYTTPPDFSGKKVAIELKNLRKTYYPSRSIFKFKKPNNGHKVLKGIDLTIYAGEVLGIIGRNGSGKSTLSKLICESYSPDPGSKVQVNGKPTLLSLTVGTNMELTAYENILLSGVVQGLSINHMKSITPGILKFAELENFKDHKLKHFSSGMASKLKFAIAINTSADIMVLDEVFAVGDYSFGAQATKLAEEKWLKDRTVVMISHSLPKVQQYCNRAIYLADGKIKAIGDPDLVCREYRRDIDPNFKEDAKLDALKDRLVQEGQQRREKEALQKDSKDKIKK